MSVTHTTMSSIKTVQRDCTAYGGSFQLLTWLDGDMRSALVNPALGIIEKVTSYVLWSNPWWVHNMIALLGSGER